MEPVRRENELSYQFDAFELDPVRRVLLKGGKSIALKPKIFETLLVLVRNNGRVMDKDELMQQVWPDTVVEEVNLAHNVSILRKTLGLQSDETRFIITVPGKGYGFVAEVTQSQRSAPRAASLSGYKSTRARVVDEEETSELFGSEVPFQENGGTRKTARILMSRPFTLAAGLVTLAIAIGLVLIVYRSLKHDAQPLREIKSIAVLPFKPLLAESRDEALELGMADTLINKLSKIGAVTVRPLSAVRKYTSLEQDAAAAGREQRVDAVLDGNIQRSGQKIRVTVRLVRVMDGREIWTEHFDEQFTDIFSVQDSVSNKVSGMLAVALTGEEKELLTKRQTANVEAYQFYMMGRYHLNRLTDEGLRKGLDYFQRAIEKDPNYALAYVGLADAYISLADLDTLPPNETFPKAKKAASQALRLDENLAEAHVSLATTKFLYDWDWTGAEDEYKRALEINPGYSDAHQMYGYYLTGRGRFDEALRQMQRALELDPVSLTKITGVGEVLHMARRDDEAIVALRKVLEMDPNFGFGHWALGRSYEEQGMYEQAIASFQKAIPLSGDSPDESAELGRAYARSGRETEALKIAADLKEQSKRRYISPCVIASVYAALGDKDQAFVWLGKGYEAHDFILVLLKVEPMFDNLRSDGRFTVLLKRVGLDQ